VATNSPTRTAVRILDTSVGLVMLNSFKRGDIWDVIHKVTSLESVITYEYTSKSAGLRPRYSASSLHL